MAHCPSTYRVGVFHVRTSKYSTWHYNCNGTKIVKVTIRPGFSGTVPIFNDVSQIKKLQFSRDAHLSRFWLHVPDLSRFAHLCSRMFTHRWSKINSDFICKYEKIAGGRGSATEPAGVTHDASPEPKSDPRRLAPVALAPYDSRLGRSSRIAVPKLWSLYVQCETHRKQIHKQ